MTLEIRLVRVVRRAERNRNTVSRYGLGEKELRNSRIDKRSDQYYEVVPEAAKEDRSFLLRANPAILRSLCNRSIVPLSSSHPFTPPIVVVVVVGPSRHYAS